MTIPRNLSFLAQGASSTGVLSVPYGGTGLTTLTAGYIPYGNGTSAFSSSANMTFDGSTLTTLNSAYTGTLTGGTGIVNLGSGQFYKDASGNVGIGTSTPSGKFNISGTGSLATLGGNSSSNVIPDMQIVRTSSGTGIQTGSNITFSDGTTNNTTTIQSGSGNLQFWNYGSGSWVERMRIDSSGNLLVGTTNSGFGGKITAIAAAGGNSAGYFLNPAAPTQGIICSYTYQTASSSNIGFLLGSGNGSAVTSNNLFIYTNGNVVNTNNSYGAISDIKLKENIIDATPKLDDLMKIKVRQYNLKDDKTKTKQIGVVAQELEEIFAGMVSETPDRDIKGNDLGTTTKQVKYSVFVPMLLKAIQEQQALIESLTQRIKTLENK